MLSIADKADATILSNDSFQEFHGEYPWLFDEGRLIGGKPVPNVGWVFVPRAPVRGPISRRSVRDTKKGGRGREPAKASGRPSKEASAPMPVPKAPPPAAAARPKADGAAKAGTHAKAAASGGTDGRSAAGGAPSATIVSPPPPRVPSPERVQAGGHERPAAVPRVRRSTIRSARR